jgi:hypothetical protein
MCDLDSVVATRGIEATLRARSPGEEECIRTAARRDRECVHFADVCAIASRLNRRIRRREDRGPGPHVSDRDPDIHNVGTFSLLNDRALLGPLIEVLAEASCVQRPEIDVDGGPAMRRIVEKRPDRPFDLRTREPRK